MHKRLFGLLASAAIVFGACSGSASPTPAASTGASTPPESAAPSAAASATSAGGIDLGATDYYGKFKPAATTGGTLVMAEWQTVAGFNIYYAAANADVEAITPSFDGLITIAEDLKYVPDLAMNIPTVNNGGVVVNGNTMDVTWNLKPGALWSDGQPITCDDLEATRAWMMDKDQVGLYAGVIGWEDITSISGGTGSTCVMHFKKLYSAYLLLVSAVFPKHYITTIPVKDAPKKLYALTNPKAGVYSGPYIPTDIKPDAQITYAPNPNWKTIGYGPDVSKNHAPYLDKVVFQYFGDSDGMKAAYRNGAIDVAMDLSDSDIDSVKDIPDSEKIIQDALFTESNYYNNVSFKKKFGDTDGPQIIRAIMEATDVQAIIDGPMGGAVTRSCNNIASPLLWFYKEEQCPKYDPADASAKLDALGWVKGADGIRAKAGKKLSVDYCTTTRPYRGQSITLIASQLKQIGIDAKVNIKPAQPDVFGGWNDVTPDTKCNGTHGNYDVLMHGYTSSPDPTAGTLVYTTKGIPDPAPHNGANETRFTNPVYDAQFDIVNTSLDTTAIKDAMAKIQDVYGSDANTGELPLFNHRNLYLVSPKVHNFVGWASSTGNWNIGDWWMDK